MNKYIAALKDLVSDIEAMQSSHDPNWFGDFSESQEVDDMGTVAIEWPNLAISVEKAQALVKEYEASQANV